MRMSDLDFPLALLLLICCTQSALANEVKADGTIQDLPDLPSDWNAHQFQATDAELRNMWMSPIYIVKVSETDRKLLNPHLIKLAREAFTECAGLHGFYADESGICYNSTAEDAVSRVPISTDGSDLNVNEAFFHWQRDEYNNDRGARNPVFSALQDHKSFQGFIHLVQREVDKYLYYLGKSEEFVRRRSLAMFAWAAVNYGGISHMSHSHPDGMVSGVYYAKVPASAGAIVFDDPRGPLPPFDGRMVYHPQEGDLLLFPSWLVHQVLATPGCDERISYSFNAPGAWTSTSDISVSSKGKK